MREEEGSDYSLCSKHMAYNISQSIFSTSSETIKETIQRYIIALIENLETHMAMNRAHERVKQGVYIEV